MLRKYIAKNGRTIIVRAAVEDDARELIDAVNSVAREGIYFLRSHFEVEEDSERAFIRGAEDRGDLLLIASLEARLVGWVTLLRGRAEFQRHTAELGIGVLDGFRGLGVGWALMDYSLSWAAAQGLEKIKLGVRASNTRALSLYRRFGFVDEGLRVRDVKDAANHYEDCIEMAWFAGSVSAWHGEHTGTQA